MVRATYRIEEDTHTLSIVGHANYDAYGKDIVCAGVSSLVQALIGWAEENYYRAKCVSVDTKGGEVMISCEGGEDVASVFSLVSIGLEQIADAYPSHVQYEFIGTAD